MAASNTIESIKRQMQNMKTSKEDAIDRLEKADQKLQVLLDRSAAVSQQNIIFLNQLIKFKFKYSNKKRNKELRREYHN